MPTTRCPECRATIELDSRGGPDQCPKCSAMLANSEQHLLSSRKPPNQDLFSVSTLDEDDPTEDAREAPRRTRDKDRYQERDERRSSRRDQYEDEGTSRRRRRRDEDDDYDQRGRRRDDRRSRDFEDDEDNETRLSRNQQREIKEANDDWRRDMLRGLLAATGLCVVLLLILLWWSALFVFGIVFGVVVIVLGFHLSSLTVRVKNGEPGSDFRPGIVPWIFPIIGFTSYPHPLLYLILGLSTSVGSICIYALSGSPDSPGQQGQQVAEGPSGRKSKGPHVPPPLIPNPPKPNPPNIHVPPPPVNPKPAPPPKKVVPKIERPTYPPAPTTRTIQTPPSAKTFSGLVGYWDFDNAESNTAKDESGNNLHSTIVAGHWDKGVRGKALELNGKTSFMTIPNSEKLNFGNKQDFTVAAWVKLATGMTDGTVLLFHDSRGYSMIHLDISKGQPVARIRKDGSVRDTSVRGSKKLPAGSWEHLAILRHGDGTVELFHNGMSVGEARHRAHFFVADGLVKTNTRVIGKVPQNPRHVHLNQRPLKGMVDELCMFQRALNKREIKKLAGLKVAKIPDPPYLTKIPGLLAHWSFDEGKGKFAVDGSGNKLVGTLEGAKWVDGVSGKAVEFDGKSTYVLLDESKKLNIPANGPFTIAGWVKPEEVEGTILSFRNSKEGGVIVDLHMHRGALHVQIRQDGGVFPPTQTRSAILPQRKWSHFSVSRNAKGDITLWLNGKGIAARGPFGGKYSRGALTTNLRSLGCEKHWIDTNYRQADQDRRWFKGAVDELYIFNRELNERDLQGVMRRKR